tara:strand:- start:80 stop:493 length:414 start_codon:yes stop_codon:yes gene_type:complete
MKLQKAEFVYKMVKGGYNYEDIAHVIKTKKLNMPFDDLTLKTLYKKGRDYESKNRLTIDEIKSIKEESKSEGEYWEELYGEQERTMDWKVKFACNDPECDSLYSRDIKMRSSHPHYAERRCVLCDRHIKWMPYPHKQ